MAEEQAKGENGGGVATAADTLSVTDNRTGESYEIEIEDGTVKAMDFRQMKVDEDDFGLMTYDPAYMNTASCRSGITYIDGDKGVLEYRGYPIEQLAERSSFLEVAYLLIWGHLPTFQELEGFRHRNHPVFCVQYHPEAAPGPHDSHYLFDDFTKLMREAK